ncbi:unnamed protein product [Gongylonema pulchrum]|uniref:Uncharacterized protein n=1 Tax=Gongylonema pulchrum TaxID=637853 RepID=A0A3P6T931_9BILA|nr:unnamed protein product [Gongylonema pulchrum]
MKKIRKQRMRRTRTRNAPIQQLFYSCYSLFMLLLVHYC